MRSLKQYGPWWLVPLTPVIVFLGLEGCQAISDRLSRWEMLGPEALQDPVKAVGGDAIVFQSRAEGRPRDPISLAAATPQEFVSNYAPVFFQQRVNTASLPHPYPKDYDEIGEAGLRRDSRGELEAFVAGAPKVYALYEKRRLGQND